MNTINIGDACDLERVREFFSRDRFATGAGVTIDSASAESVQCSLQVSKSHLNAGDRLQGGAIFTLADLTFAVHSNLDLALGKPDARITVGQSCHISYFRPVSEGVIVARSTLLQKGRAVSVYRVRVENGEGAPVAEFVGNGYSPATRQ